MDEYLEETKVAMNGILKTLRRNKRDAEKSGSNKIALITNVGSRIMKVIMKEMNSKYKNYTFTMTISNVEEGTNVEYIIEFTKKVVDDPMHPGWTQECLDIMEKYKDRFLERYIRGDSLSPSLHTDVDFFRGQQDYGICGHYLKPPLFYECCLYMKEYIKVLELT